MIVKYHEHEFVEGTKWQRGRAVCDDDENTSYSMLWPPGHHNNKGIHLPGDMEEQALQILMENIIDIFGRAMETSAEREYNRICKISQDLIGLSNIAQGLSDIQIQLAENNHK